MFNNNRSASACKSRYNNSGSATGGGPKIYKGTTKARNNSATSAQEHMNQSLNGSTGFFGSNQSNLVLSP